MEITGFWSNDSEIPVVFPALSRAKQRFLERKATASSGVSPIRRSSPSEPPQTAEAQDDAAAQAVGVSPQVSTITRTVLSRSAPVSRNQRSFCKLVLDLCDDLHIIGDEVHVIDASVRQHYQRICADLDTLTTRFINGNSAKPEEDCLAETVTPCGFPAACEEVTKEPSQSLDRSVKSTQARQAQKDQHRQHQQKHQRHSRVSLLALQAVYAHVIQHHYRRFLYCRLYPRGKAQFAVAKQLCRRASLNRVWHRWRDNFSSQRRRTKEKFAKIESRLSARANEICTLQAAKVRESDGKYAMAKRFYEMKVLCFAFRRWLACQ